MLSEDQFWFFCVVFFFVVVVVLSFVLSEDWITGDKCTIRDISKETFSIGKRLMVI